MRAIKKKECGLVLVSGSADSNLTLQGPLIHVQPGQNWRMSGLFEKGSPFSGTILMAVTLFRRHQKGVITNQNFAVKEPFLVRADGWMSVHQSFTIPADGESIQVQIRGKFRGTIRARNLSLTLNHHPDHERSLPRPARPDSPAK